TTLESAPPAPASARSSSTKRDSARVARRPVAKIHFPVRTIAMAESIGKAHWASKGEKRLFLWEKPSTAQGTARGTILFVHGSSEASTPVFDLHVPGREHSSAI